MHGVCNALLVYVTLFQAAQSQAEHAENICQRLLSSNSKQLLVEQHRLKEGNTLSDMSSTFTPQSLPTNREKEQTAPVMYTRQLPSLPTSNAPQVIEENPRKSAAAAVVAKLTASTSSAQMLAHVLSSLASGGGISNPLKESSDDHNSEKRLKIENDSSSYMEQPPQHPQPPPFPHPDSLLPPHQPSLTPSSSSPMPQPPPPPPPVAASTQPPSHFMQTAGSMTSVPYSYGSSAPRRPQQPPLPSYPMHGNQLSGIPPHYPSPPNTYQNLQGSSGTGFYNHHQPLPAAPPISRQ